MSSRSENKTFTIESSLWVPNCLDYSLLLVSLGASRLIYPHCSQLQELEKKIKGLVPHTTSKARIEEECMKLIHIYLNQHPDVSLLLPSHWTNRKRKPIIQLSDTTLPRAKKKAKSTTPQTDHWDEGNGDWYDH